MPVQDFLSMVSTLHLPASPYPFALAASISLLVISERLDSRRASFISNALSSLIVLSSAIVSAQAKLNLLDPNALQDPANRSTIALLVGLGFSFIANLTPTPDHGQTSANEAHSILWRRGTRSALAHIAYTASFLLAAFPTFPTGITIENFKSSFRYADFGMAVVFVGLFVDWSGLVKKERAYDAWFEVPGELNGGIRVYAFLTATMVATATATDKGYQHIAAAWVLAVSELCGAAELFGVDPQEEKETETEKVQGRKRDEKVRTHASNVTTKSVKWILYYSAHILLAGSI